MTSRAALIEALAEREYVLQMAGFPGLTQWDDLPASVRETRRKIVIGYSLPLIVEFVAEWLANYDGPWDAAYPDVVAREWLEEMGDDAGEGAS